MEPNAAEKGDVEKVENPAAVILLYPEDVNATTDMRQRG
jgi:hypothetical protein